jgi:PAS domain S-box-containing protein
MEGRISYVNPAFCAMTGFSESDLIGQHPPFPYWPHDRIDENARLLEQELQGKSPTGGIEVKVMRKDGSVFDARMYVSPLIDPKGQQTGWMTSMTNITEAKRIRDQLTASHERFTTVLEGLDAAVSVLSVQQGELLFANRSYRLWFGSDAHIHAVLAGGIDANAPTKAEIDDVDGFGGLPAQELTEAGTSPREVFVESLDKWFDVRARYLQWTDGRLAQMLIATDITMRRHAEAQAALQADKAQVKADKEQAKADQMKANGNPKAEKEQVKADKAQVKADEKKEGADKQENKAEKAKETAEKKEDKAEKKEDKAKGKK